MPPDEQAHRVMVAARRAAMLYGPKLKGSGPCCASSTEKAFGGGLAALTAAAVSCAQWPQHRVHVCSTHLSDCNRLDASNTVLSAESRHPAAIKPQPCDAVSKVLGT